MRHNVKYMNIAFLVTFCVFSYFKERGRIKLLDRYKETQYGISVHYYKSSGARGGVVVKALNYKPAGRGFDSRWCHWNFSLT